MGRSPSMPMMIALAAVLSAPPIIEADNSLIDPVTVVASGEPTVPGAGGRTYDLVDRCVYANAIIGASVYNPQNERIGSIAEVLTGTGDRTPGAVLSLGGFRGITGKSVEVPYGLIELVNDKLVIAGTTKNRLMQLSAYQFGSRS